MTKGWKQRVDEHPIVVVGGAFILGVTIAWATEKALLVGPRDDEIRRLHDDRGSLEQQLQDARSEIRELKAAQVPAQTPQSGARPAAETRVTQKMSGSTGSIQAGRDVNITSPLKQPVPAVARFPLEFQVARAKERIRYLAYEYLHVDTMSLLEVVGAYGDNMLDSPNLYDWPKVLEKLEVEGYIKILKRDPQNIIFKVTRSQRDWVSPNPPLQPTGSAGG